jgi:hypothetical protein
LTEGGIRLAPAVGRGAREIHRQLLSRHLAHSFRPAWRAFRPAWRANPRPAVVGPGLPARRRRLGYRRGSGIQRLPPAGKLGDRRPARDLEHHPAAGPGNGHQPAYLGTRRRRPAPIGPILLCGILPGALPVSAAGWGGPLVPAGRGLGNGPSGPLLELMTRAAARMAITGTCPAAFLMRDRVLEIAFAGEP